MSDNLLFQYCQKLIILSPDRKSVLLASRKGEADYDGTYSFVGGKMETTDESIVAGMKREKDEELGEAAIVLVDPTETSNLLFRKKDGNAMIVVHIACLFVSGEIVLSDEYSDYKWVPLDELEGFEPKIPNIPEYSRWAADRLANITTNHLIEI